MSLNVQCRNFFTVNETTWPKRGVMGEKIKVKKATYVSACILNVIEAVRNQISQGIWGYIHTFLQKFPFCPSSTSSKNLVVLYFSFSSHMSRMTFTSFFLSPNWNAFTFTRRQKRTAAIPTVRLLTHVLCKPTHFFFHPFIATMSYSLQTSFDSVMKDWVDK